MHIYVLITGRTHVLRLWMWRTYIKFEVLTVGLWRLGLLICNNVQMVEDCWMFWKVVELSSAWWSGLMLMLLWQLGHYRRWHYHPLEHQELLDQQHYTNSSSLYLNLWQCLSQLWLPTAVNIKDLTTAKAYKPVVQRWSLENSLKGSGHKRSVKNSSTRIRLS